MIKNLRIGNFKRFKNFSIELGQSITVLVGPNNSGKTSLLQALMLWNTGYDYLYNLMEDAFSHSIESSQKPVIKRLDLSSISTPYISEIWNNRNFQDDNQEDIYVEIEINGTGTEYYERDEEEITIEAAWSQIHFFKFIDDDHVNWGYSSNGTDPRHLYDYPISITFLPTISRIEAKETLLDYKQLRQLGRAGQISSIVRNLCWRIFSESNDSDWKRINDAMDNMFHVKLSSPEHIVEDNTISVLYCYINQPHVTFDIASAGRALIQTLSILLYLYDNPRTIVLLDEPDTHLDILLQRGIYKYIKEAAKKTHSQVILTTHSAEIMDEAKNEDTIIALLNEPIYLTKSLGKTDTKQSIEKILKTIPYHHYYLALLKQWVLYVEGTTDIKILEAFAEKINHRASKTFTGCFLYPIEGDRSSYAIQHFNSLKKTVKELQGIVILDQTGTLPSKRIEGLNIQRWKRYEIENYICQPETLVSYAQDGDGNEERKQIMQNIIKKLIPEEALNNPNNSYWKDEPVSKTLLPLVFEEFSKALNEPLIRKTNFYILARYVPAELIDPEVIEKLDAIWDIARDAPNT